MKVLPPIRRMGLKTMDREHIHMAPGLPGDGEVISGCRDGANCFIFVDVRRALVDGIEFRRSGNNVILTPGINGTLPPKYQIGAVDGNGKLIFVEDPRGAGPPPTGLRNRIPMYIYM